MVILDGFCLAEWLYVWNPESLGILEGFFSLSIDGAATMDWPLAKLCGGCDWDLLDELESVDDLLEDELDELLDDAEDLEELDELDSEDGVDEAYEKAVMGMFYLLIMPILIALTVLIIFCIYRAYCAGSKGDEAQKKGDDEEIVLVKAKT